MDSNGGSTYRGACGGLKGGLGATALKYNNTNAGQLDPNFQSDLCAIGYVSSHFQSLVDNWVTDWSTYKLCSREILEDKIKLPVGLILRTEARMAELWGNTEQLSPQMLSPPALANRRALSQASFSAGLRTPLSHNDGHADTSSPYYSASQPASSDPGLMRTPVHDASPADDSGHRLQKRKNVSAVVTSISPERIAYARMVKTEGRSEMTHMLQLIYRLFIKRMKKSKTICCAGYASVKGQGQRILGKADGRQSTETFTIAEAWYMLDADRFVLELEEDKNGVVGVVCLVCRVYGKMKNAYLSEHVKTGRASIRHGATDQHRKAMSSAMLIRSNDRQWNNFLSPVSKRRGGAGIAKLGDGEHNRTLGERPPQIKVKEEKQEVRSTMVSAGSFSKYRKPEHQIDADGANLGFVDLGSPARKGVVYHNQHDVSDSSADFRNESNSDDSSCLYDEDAGGSDCY
jgi:hypothetical protein